MKYIITLLCAVTLTTVGVSIRTDNIEFAKNITEQSIENCTAFQPVAYYKVSTNSDTEYYHCRYCGIGVFLPNKEGVIRCTHCESNKE